MSSGVTIYPDVTEVAGVEAGPHVTIWPGVGIGNTSGTVPLLLLMTGSNILTMVGNNISLV